MRHFPAPGALALLSLVACSEPAPTDEQPDWELLHEGLEYTLFSIWGTDTNDLWTVGADIGDGSTVLHFDGEVWTKLDTGTTGTLWWVSGRGDDVWMSGEGGLVVRYRRSEDSFEAQPSLGENTIWGVLPLSENEVWAVGGTFEGTGSGVIYRYDGDEWALVDDVPEEAQSSPFFKVWGPAGDDLWFVGFSPVVLHFDGKEFEVLPTPTGGPLRTIHGNDSFVAAVGGLVDGLLVEGHNGELSDVTPDIVEVLNGVWVTETERALAVGNAGTIYNRNSDGEWSIVPNVPETFNDYHAVFVDASGHEWAVGGKIIAPPYDEGMLAHRGPEVSAQIDD